MLYLYEFELFEDEGSYLAFPFDMEGGTSGETLREACEMAYDWLKTECEARLINRVGFPEPTFGNEPAHGGEVFLVGVEASLESIPRVLPSEAARILGVTPGRVTQMVSANRLEAVEVEGRKWITRASIEARLAERPKAGRPKKQLVKA